MRRPPVPSVKVGETLARHPQNKGVETVRGEGGSVQFLNPKARSASQGFGGGGGGGGFGVWGYFWMRQFIQSILNVHESGVTTPSHMSGPHCIVAAQPRPSGVLRNKLPLSIRAGCRVQRGNPFPTSNQHASPGGCTQQCSRGGGILAGSPCAPQPLRLGGPAASLTGVGALPLGFTVPTLALSFGLCSLTA